LSPSSAIVAELSYGLTVGNSCRTCPDAIADKVLPSGVDAQKSCMHLLKSEHSCGNYLLLIVVVRQAISCYYTIVAQGAMWRLACRLVSIGLATAAARGTVLCQKLKPTQQFRKLLNAEWIMYSTRGLVINELLGEGHTSKGGKKSLLLNNSIVPRGVIQYALASKEGPL
jgi:hypothetical protein